MLHSVCLSVLFIATSALGEVDMQDCAVSWNGPVYLVKLDQPVLFKHADGIVVATFHVATAEPPDTLSVLMEGVVVKPGAETVERINGQVLITPGPYGQTYSRETGCTFDLDLFELQSPTRAGGGYIVLKSWAKDHEKIAHMNYTGDRLDQFDANRLKPFLTSTGGSFKPKRKLWMNRDGQMFEGDFHSQNEIHAVVDGLKGQKYTLAKADLSEGDRLFLERCQYGQFDMRDENSRPHQYLPPQVLRERAKQGP